MWVRSSFLTEALVQVYNKAGETIAEGSNVVPDGPGPVAVTMTPEAAAATSDHLLEAAALAAGQRALDPSI